jgi:SAM-dependent methyltransferase
LVRLEKLRKIESWHFWFVSRRELVASLLRRELRDGETLLDVGCGTGTNLALASEGVRRIGIDIHIEELSRGMMQGDAMSLPLRSESVDVVLALDVLEHVDDDAMFAEVARVLRRGGRLIATVPAMRALWSVRDDAAGHQRRYDRTMVRELVMRHHFTIRELRGFQFLLLPLLLLSRVTRRKSLAARDFEDAPPRWLNRLFLAVNRMEQRFFRPPIGSSLALVAVKER